MAFVETPRFPEIISAQSKFGPRFSTAVARNRGGYEVRNRSWTYPLHEGDVSMVKTQDELDDLLAFYHYVAGRQTGFRFKCFNDYLVTTAEGTFISLTSNTWQLCKTRTFGALSTQWKVYKPVSGTVIVTGSGTYSVNYTTGVVTDTGGTNTPTSWSGQFDFPVRFDTDAFLPEWISFEIYNAQSLPIVELRL